jgi:hypothetical protein
MNDQAHDRQIDNEIPLIPHEIVGKERVPAVIESRNRVIDSMIQSCPGWKIHGKTYEEKEGPKGFRDERKPENHLGNHNKIPSRGMKEGRLHNLPSLEREPTTH